MSFLHEIERLANHARVAMESTRDAIEFAVHRDGVDVRIRVAPDVLEWSVEAVDQATGAQASERWDYTGYDDCTRSELEASLLEDLSEFITEGRDLFRASVTPELFKKNYYDRAIVDRVIKPMAALKTPIW